MCGKFSRLAGFARNTPLRQRVLEFVRNKGPHNLDHGLVRGEAQGTGPARLEAGGPDADDVSDALVLDASYKR